LKSSVFYRGIAPQCTFIVCVLLSGCNGLEKLDEKVFYEGPHFKLKLARYYESIFLHFNGEVFSVQCQSSATSNYQAKKRQEPGWRLIGTGAAIGSKNAQEVINMVSEDYIIVSDQTFVKKGGGISVSFDACGTITGWYPTLLPLQLIDQIEKPDWCAPKGGGDCRHYDFEGDRQVRIDDIKTDNLGNISFLARSKAFKDSAILRIASSDYGRTWEHEIVAKE
jgi:hypothetical protein